MLIAWRFQYGFSIDLFLQLPSATAVIIFLLMHAVYARLKHSIIIIKIRVRNDLLGNWDQFYMEVATCYT